MNAALHSARIYATRGSWEYDHRMQADQPSCEELCNAYSTVALVVGVPKNVARKAGKEVDSEINTRRERGEAKNNYG
jgi:RNase H-fold protein (predicted Holliday junction resolvase)